MRRAAVLCLGLLAATVVGCGAPAPAATSAPHPAQAGTAADTLTVGGLVTRPRNWTLSELESMPQKTVTASFMAEGKPETHRYVGTPLFGILEQAGPKLDPKIKNDKLRTFVQATGRDGYQTVVAWGEIDPDFENKPVLVAWHDNGQPLPASQAPFRLVVPDDRFGGRYVSQLVSLELRSG